MLAFPVAAFLAIGAGEVLITGGRLGIGRKSGVSVGSGVSTGVEVAVGITVAVALGVISGVGVILGVVRRRERGPGLIGRTGSKYWVSPCSARVARLVSASPGTGRAVSLGCAVADGGTEATGVSAGEIPDVSLGDSAAIGDTVGVGEVFLFLRCFGVGVGRTKS